MASGVGLHISQALKGRAKKALEFTQLIKAIGARTLLRQLLRARPAALHGARHALTPAPRAQASARARLRRMPS